MTLDFAPLAWVYFIVIVATLTITIASGSHALIFGAVAMLASWLASNEIVRAEGTVALIRHDAAISALLGCSVATVGRIAGSRPLAIVFGLFAVNVAVDVGFLAAIGAADLNVSRNVTFCYACIVNAIFLASCLALGTAGVGTRLADRSSARHRLTGRARKRRPSVVAGAPRKTPP